MHKEKTLRLARKFECSKFIFTPICIDDTQILFDALSSKAFPSSLPLAKIESLTQAECWCADRVLDWEQGKCYVWSCRRSLDSKMIGQVTLLPQQHHLALAYWIHPCLWGQGFATQMCQSLLSHIHSAGYRGSVWAGVHLWNMRSVSVLQKLGFKQIESDDKSTEAYRLEIA